MHYAILKWANEKWVLVHWSHDFNDMDRMMKEYPEDNGFVHLIDIKYLKSHNILERVKALKEKAGLI